MEDDKKDEVTTTDKSDNIFDSITIDEDVFNALKDEISKDFINTIDDLKSQLLDKEKELNDTIGKLQDANRNRIITINRKVEEKEPVKEVKEVPLFI